MQILELITDAPRDADRPVEIRSLSFKIPKAEGKWAETGLAAFLFRYSGQEEIPFAVRCGSGEKWLTRVLPVSGEDPFSSLADRMADSEPVQEEGAQILLILGEAELPERFEVAFSLNDDGLTLRYDSQLYREATMERWAAYFVRFLAAATENPDTPIREVEMLDDAERHRMLKTWNSHSPGSQSFYRDEPSPDFCLQRVFEKQVERTPDRPAAKSHGRVWTYRELDGYANQIAHFLLHRG